MASPSASPLGRLPGELAWSALAVPDSPAAREDQTWTVDSAGGYAYLFGGRAGGEAMADLWRYDLQTDSWTQLEPPAPRPAARFGHVAAWMDGLGLLIWSGQQDASTFFADTWRYEPLTNSWQQLPDGGDVPLARYGSCGGVGPDGRLWISHGFTDDRGRFFDTRAYDTAAGAWSDLTPSGDKPVDRCLHDCFWTTGGQLLLYAGQTTGAPALGDLWAYDPSSGAWAEQSDPPAPARQLYALAVLREEAFVYGGADIDRDFLGDLWRLDLATLAWSEVSSAGAGPVARSGATMVVDAARQRLLLFGGMNADGELDDVWQLSGAAAGTN